MRSTDAKLQVLLSGYSHGILALPTDMWLSLELWGCLWNSNLGRWFALDLASCYKILAAWSGSDDCQVQHYMTSSEDTNKIDTVRRSSGHSHYDARRKRMP